MPLITDARRLAPRLWSVRLAIVSAALSAAEVALPYLAPAQPSGRFAALSGLVALAAAIARLITQQQIHPPADPAAPDASSTTDPQETPHADDTRA